MPITREFVGRLAAGLDEIFVYGLAFDGGLLVYADLFGTAPALDAAYTRLVVRGEELTVVPETGPSLALRTQGVYVRSTAALPVRGRYNHVLQRRPDKVRGYFVVSDGEPAPYLLAGAKACSAVPIRVDWQNWLLDAAAVADATSPSERQGQTRAAGPSDEARETPTGTPTGLPVFAACACYGGVRVYSYSANPADWERLVVRGIKTGRIAF